jgi:uncharacterized protein involved in response to NO
MMRGEMSRVTTRAPLRAYAEEPYRVMFPLAVLAGIFGAALWPLHLGGLTEQYPGIAHARLMAHGFFGGFIFGFLGTAGPRMLSAPPLRGFETCLIAAGHAAMVIAYGTGAIGAGDALFLFLLGSVATMLGLRARQRKDTPPPGFVLVGLAFLVGAAGAALGLLESGMEEAPRWAPLQRLFSYQGFVLLPILGVGPFILPRFGGWKSAHDFPEMLKPSPAWTRKALLALGVGVVVVATFFLEAAGWHRLAHALRFAAVSAHLLIELPLARQRMPGGKGAHPALVFVLRSALVSIALGYLAVAVFPEYRVGLLHLALVGGFAALTLVVATRVLYGHGGNLPLLAQRKRWLIVVFVLMFIGMATRISGDLWPKVMASHYVYGSALWILGVVLWAARSLPQALIAEPED